MNAIKFWPSAIAWIILACTCVAAETPTAGTIISMQSVACGTKQQGKKESTSLLCQQYVVRTATTEYQIRQPKPAEQNILPVNTPIQFTLDKDKIKFALNGRKYEFLVVGASAVLSVPSRPNTVDPIPSATKTAVTPPL
jgi:hypothetical protein